MSNRKELGFSLIELLLVVTIIGIIAALAVPALQKGLRAAENGTTFATMRTISSTQIGFYSQNNRFGRLAEVNQQVGNGIGTVAGDSLIRGRFTFRMAPLTPTDNDLRNEYMVIAERTVPGETIYRYELNQTGTIIQVLP